MLQTQIGPLEEVTNYVYYKIIQHNLIICFLIYYTFTNKIATKDPQSFCQTPGNTHFIDAEWTGAASQTCQVWIGLRPLEAMALALNDPLHRYSLEQFH